MILIIVCFFLFYRKLKEKGSIYVYKIKFKEQVLWKDVYVVVYLTLDTDEVITDICDVCFWQYDEVVQNMPDEIIGANQVSLNTAKKNYKLFGAIKERFINIVRQPYEDEV